MSQLLDEVARRRRVPAPAVARAIRVEAGVSQQRLADEVGVHRMTVARWEAGERRPRGAMAARWAEVLDSLREAAS
ncbi:MAG: helix-turn-helix domain-containing protein [Actinomycetota bacterium]|nr:helix-turn-helix domain-containing protein [Actinomycetota bacterium]